MLVTRICLRPLDCIINRSRQIWNGTSKINYRKGLVIERVKIIFGIEQRI
jgi:hypothetical protein